MIVFDQLNKNDPHLRTVTWGVLIGLVILLGGLWWVQIISYRHYAENQKAQSFRTVRIPAIRGKILDRHGVPLAENQPSYNVGLYLDELREPFRREFARLRPRQANTNAPAFWQRWLGLKPVKTPPARLSKSQLKELTWQARYGVASNVVANLSATLQEPFSLSADQFRRHYTNQLPLPLPVFTGLNPTQIARFQERGNPPGVDLDLQPSRVYPGGTLAAHLLGYLTSDNESSEGEESFFNFRLPDYRGRIGIEGAYDPELRGRAGAKSVLVNSLGYRQSETTWAEGEPGRNVVLTIDLAIQRACENALQNTPMFGYRVRGAVVVLDPNNGDLLAMVSAPAFDPNKFIPKITHEEYAKLTNEITRPQINRAMQENFAPGSIFKIVTALACIEAGLNPEETFQNPGYIMVPGRHRPFKDTAPPGEYNFRRGFLRSSNHYFITNTLRYGAQSLQNIVKYGQRLHLGERTRLLSGQETPGEFPSLKKIQRGWTYGDTANFCIGQGPISTTPLQMALMVAAIANGGKVLWPRLVDRIEPADPHSDESPVVFPRKPVRDELGASPRALQLVRDAMLADVEDEKEGSGRAAAVPGFRICGKTGTAQVMNERNEKIDQTTWFASYGPYESPRYVVIVMVESGASGGGTCAPVAREIYRQIQQLETSRTPVMARNP